MMRKKGIVTAFLGGLALIILAILPTGTFEDVLFVSLWTGMGNLIPVLIPVFVIDAAVVLFAVLVLIVMFPKG